MTSRKITLWWSIFTSALSSFTKIGAAVFDLTLPSYLVLHTLKTYVVFLGSPHLTFSSSWICPGSGLRKGRGRGLHWEGCSGLLLQEALGRWWRQLLSALRWEKSQHLWLEERRGVQSQNGCISERWIKAASLSVQMTDWVKKTWMDNIGLVQKETHIHTHTTDAVH